MEHFDIAQLAAIDNIFDGFSNRQETGPHRLVSSNAEQRSRAHKRVNAYLHKEYIVFLRNSNQRLQLCGIRGEGFLAQYVLSRSKSQSRASVVVGMRSAFCFMSINA